MKTIMVIDDDININNLLFEILTKNGYNVTRAWSGSEAEMLLEKQRPDLILLDRMLPGISGDDLLCKIKDIPVIVISAKNDISGKISLLTEGAVDYITKPFDTGELLARIAVQFRRMNIVCSSALSYDKIEMDTISHSVTVDGNPVSLTKTEFAILKLLLSNPEKALTKNFILDSIGIDTPDCTEYSLKQHVSNLRKKITSAGGRDYIESVWGIGFILK